jgi:hypothetical protein
MNSGQNEFVGQEVDVEVVHEMDVGLVEVGAVSETKGGFIGFSQDNGGGYTKTGYMQM